MFTCLLGNRIGWNYDASQVSDIDDFEESRGPRKVNMEFVLNRSEREALLSEWNIDMKIIAASTRAATKAKFERKQTIINSRKLSKLEAMMETTSKKLKNTLLLKRRINPGAEKPLESTSEVFASDLSGAGDTVSISSVGDSHKTQSNSSGTEVDDNIIEKFTKTSLDDPSAGRRDESDGGVSKGDDFTLGATTLGNTSAFSPSVIEMEKFYKELELEMFGEEIELPSMIGQTLEVPLDTNGNDTISENATSQDETSFHENKNSDRQSPYLEQHPKLFFPGESQRDSYDSSALRYAQHTYEEYDGPIGNYQFTENHQDPMQVEPVRAHSYNGSMSSPVSEYPITQRPTMTVTGSGPVQRNYAQVPFYPSMYSPRDGYQRNSSPRGASFDSAYDLSQRRSGYHNVSPASQLGLAQTYSQYEHIQKASSLDAVDFNARYGPPRPHFTERRSVSGEPRVHYMPERGSFSSYGWKDGDDRQPPFCNNEGAVIITED